MRTSFHINLSHRILIYSEFVSSRLDVQFIPGPITNQLWGLEMWYQLFPISSAKFWVWNFWKGTVGVTYPPFFTFQYWNSVLAMVYLHLLFFFFLFFISLASLHLTCSILLPTSGSGFVFLFWVALLTPLTLFPYVSVPSGCKDYKELSSKLA